MVQRRITAFAIIASILVVTTLPISGAAATSDELVVGSQHTDFGTGDESSPVTLDNLTVSGGGDDASVVLETGSKSIDRFEDGDLSEYSGDTSYYDVQTGTVHNGTYALDIQGKSTSGQHYIESSSGLDNYPQEGDSFEFYTQPKQSGSGSFGLRFGVQDSNNFYRVDFRPWTDQFSLRKEENGSETTLDSASHSYSTEWYRVAVDWGSDGSITVDVYDSTGTNVGTLNATDTTYTSGGVGFWGPGSDGNGGYMDDLLLQSDAAYQTAQYGSSTHEVSNGERAAINITKASNVSVDLSVVYHDGTGWTEANSTTVSTAGNHTLDLPETSSESWRVNASVDATGSSPEFELSDESILFMNHLPEADSATATPQGGEETNNENVNLSVDVSDPEFATTQGEEVTVNFVVDGSVIDTQTVTSNQTVETTATGLEDGDHTWHVEMTDSYGATSSSDTYSFTVNHYAAEPDNSSASPQGGEEINNEDIESSIAISDQDFAESSGDEVQVDFYLDGSLTGSKNITSNQTVSFNSTGLSDGDHTWHVETTDEYGLTSSSGTFSFTVNHYAPGVTLEEPEDGAKLDQSDVTLGTTVTDRDFSEDSGDSVEIQFQTRDPSSSSFSTQDTITITSNRTVNTTITADLGGEWDWRVIATDEYSQSTTSTQRQFSVPDTLYIRNETDTDQLVGDSIDTTVRFFGDDQIYSRSTSDGQLNLTGLPVNQDFIVEVEPSSNYHGRTVYIQTIYEQQDVYVLNDSLSSVESRFVLDDPTGQFNSETIVFVEKPINQSGTVAYKTIHADRFGSEGVTTNLHEGARYRLRVRSDTGTTQDIGPYRADVGESVTVQPGTPTISLEDLEEGWEADASLNNQTLEYVYKDPDQLTDSVTVSVHEKNNESNQLESRTYYDLGEVSGTYSLNENQSEKTWVVTFDVDRDGEQQTVKREVMNKADLVPGLSNAWKLVVGIGIMLVSAGIFSLLNASVGGVVVAIEGGILWWTGWLGSATTGAAVVIALFVAVTVHIYSSSGP